MKTTKTVETKTTTSNSQTKALSQEWANIRRLWRIEAGHAVNVGLRRTKKCIAEMREADPSRMGTDFWFILGQAFAKDVHAANFFTNENPEKVVRWGAMFFEPLEGRFVLAFYINVPVSSKGDNLPEYEAVASWMGKRGLTLLAPGGCDSNHPRRGKDLTTVLLIDAGERDSVARDELFSELWKDVFTALERAAKKVAPAKPKSTPPPKQGRLRLVKCAE